MKKIYTKLLLMFVMLISISAYMSAQKNLLFIGRADPPEGFMMDRDLIDSLANWGYSITYITSPGYALATADVYTGNDGVFVSETVNSADLTNFGVRDNYPLPSVNTEGFVPRTNRWTWLTDDAAQFHQAATDAGTEDEKVIVIKDNSHYITKIFNIDEEVAWSSAAGADIAPTRAVSVKEVNIPYTAKLAKNKAIASEADFWTMFTINSSATFPNNMFFWGMVAPGINGADQLQHLGTQAFFTIIKRACEWAYNLIPEQPTNIENHQLNTYNLVAFPNPATDKATIRFRVTDAHSATVSIHDITGRQLEVIMDNTVQPGNNFVFQDVSKYSAGIYVIKLNIGVNTQYTKLIIK